MLDDLYVGVQGSGRPLWFWIASPAQSLHQLITHSYSLSLLIGFVSLFAGFKDKEILIELLCYLTSQCITRQLDINHPPSSACVCMCVLGAVWVVYPWLKAFPLIQLRLLWSFSAVCLSIWGDQLRSRWVTTKCVLLFYYNTPGLVH